MSEFFSDWVIVLAALTFFLSLFLFLWGLRVRIPTQADGTTGHDWDGIREGMHRLPWWFIVYSAVGFIAGFAYLALYPGLGSFKGLLGWTSHDQLQRSTAANDAKLEAVVKPWGALAIQQLAGNKEAVGIGHTLYLDNCAACHGSKALGNPALGAPDLTDAVWQYGGDGDSILASILDGRTQVMPAWGPVLGDAGLKETVAYVLSLSGRTSQKDLVAAGKTRFDTLCVGCHGPGGTGRAGIPNLADDSWVWGRDEASIETSIRDGRTGVMPAWRSRLSEDQARLIAGWVVAQAPPGSLTASAAAISAPIGPAIDNAALGDEANGDNWAAYGRTFSEQRFSPLKQINSGNVSRLGLAWSIDLDTSFATTAPIEVDGVIYFSPGVSEVHAVDAKTGQYLWRYDPQVVRVLPNKMRLSWGTRGLAFWKGKVYVGTRDGRLIALDARTGKPVWQAQVSRRDDGSSITGAPRVFNGKIIMGFGGGDFGVLRGAVATYDAETGKELWRFYTVPGEPAKGFEDPTMERAAKTWTGEWWKYGGGGAVWNAMTYDPKYNRVYLGTGNGIPWDRTVRSPGGGDNLFLCSIVALDADTGKYVWHYQISPGDSWDYDNIHDMVLTELTINGKKRDVLMQAAKNGFFYIIDRATGKLISAEKFSKVTWAERIDLTTGRPVETKNARYTSGAVVAYPGPLGAHNWYAMSFSPDTGLVYIPATELPGAFNDKGNSPAELNVDAPMGIGKASLLAWNPVLQKKAWEVTTAGYVSGSTMATAGNLVFHGQADGTFAAYAADSGKQLWSFKTDNAIFAPPSTFSVDGKQYVSVLSGNSGTSGILGSPQAQYGFQLREHPRRLLTFVLDGTAKTSPNAPSARAIPLDDPSFKVDPALARKGGDLYATKLCIICHGAAAIAGGGAPDLRAAAVPLTQETFEQVVRNGALAAKGMPPYAELTDADLTALRHYLRGEARKALAAAKKP